MYNKLFGKILDSSIWLEPVSTRIVWITLLAAMDEDGYAHFSALENLAARARVTVEEAEQAVKCFMAPDPNSGNPDNEGRRVERVPGGFLILNAKVHRDTMNRVVQKEQNRIRVARHRAKKNKPVESNGITQDPLEPSEKLKTPEFMATWGKWMNYRRGLKAVKDWKGLFRAQLDHLSGFDASTATEMLNQTMRNGWIGIFELKGTHAKDTGKPNPRNVGLCIPPISYEEAGRRLQERQAQELARKMAASGSASPATGPA